MGKYTYNEILMQVQKEEQKFSLFSNSIEEACKMTAYLQSLLLELKGQVINYGFESVADEINFVKVVKPQILGRLIYYNKVYKIETGCPVSKGKLYTKYYSTEFQLLKKEYQDYICISDFFRYYRSERTDRDIEYFTTGKINAIHGLSSYVFEFDTHFSTYYDYKVAEIIANEFFYTFLLSKISNYESCDISSVDKDYVEDIFWTGSKNALIELIYALYLSGSISHGKVGIRKIVMVFQILFRTNLSDPHHAFHRMKERAGSQTAFIDLLKSSLEDYMNKD